jgi:predicted HTH domain antitoxin
MTRPITVDVPENAVKLFGGDEARFSREMFETAVVKWFDEGLLSQGQASELLGISRGELFDLLNRHKVSPIQMTPEELEEECRRG